MNAVIVPLVVLQALRPRAKNPRGDGFWDEPCYTGGGFPRVFSLRHHGYSKCFPLWALALP